MRAFGLGLRSSGSRLFFASSGTASSRGSRLFSASSGTASSGAVVDLRSDTVTKPSEGMRLAMQRAVVGDDVYGEDPTVNELQSRVAEMLGKDAALFVPSGTQSNLIAVGTHCGRGEEMILGKQSHVFAYEGGGGSGFMGASLNLVENEPDGSICPSRIVDAIRPLNNDHYPVTKCVAMENTHNVRGGTIVPQDKVRSVARVCQAHGLQLHLDGARIWNAHVASGLPLLELCQPFDTVSVCLSKGLGAPVGSLLCGSRDFVARAKRLRKALGGGMRQAGVLAAAGLYALDNNIPRLADDHARLARISAGLKALPEAIVSVTDPATNILFFEVRDGKGKLFCAAMKERGVLVNSYGSGRVRAVTHLGVGDGHVDQVIEAARAVCKELFPPRARA